MDKWKDIRELAHKATQGKWRIDALRWNHISGGYQAAIHTKEKEGILDSTRMIGAVVLFDSWSGETDEDGYNGWELPMQDNADHIAAANPATIRALLAERDALLEALEHIAEYWNKDSNQAAMHDALWHIIETAADALEAAKRQEGV